jgi:hypothetical protein
LAQILENKLSFPLGKREREKERYAGQQGRLQLVVGSGVRMGWDVLTCRSLRRGLVEYDVPKDKEQPT